MTINENFNYSINYISKQLLILLTCMGGFMVFMVFGWSCVFIPWADCKGMISCPCAF